MMTITNFRALAGQNTVPGYWKGRPSLLVVGLAAVVSREGLALTIMIIFMGVALPSGW